MSAEETTSNLSPNDVTNTPSPEGAITNAPGSPALLSAALGSVVKFYAGLDLGVYHSVAAASDAETTQVVELECNDLAGRSTPSVIAFHRSMRLVGDTAENVMTKEPLSTMALLPLLLGQPDLRALKQRFGPLLSFLGAVQGDGRIRVSFGGQTWNLEPSQILAAYLRRLAMFVVDGRNTRHTAGEVSLSSGQYCISLPDRLFAPGVRQSVLTCVAQACRTGAFRWELTKVASQMTAAVAGWLVRNLPTVLEQLPAQVTRFAVGFFNLGFSEASMQMITITRQSDMNDGTPKNNETDNSISFNDVSVSFGPFQTLDVGAFDFAKEIAALYVAALAKKNIKVAWSEAFDAEASESLNRAQRKAVSSVLSSSLKLMKDLSGLTLAHSTYSDEETDVQIEVTRDQFEQACREKLAAVSEMIRSVVTQTLETETETALLGVEVLGGGSRIPCVQKTLENEVCGLWKSQLSDSLLRRTLDGTAASSFGATLIASGLAPSKLPNVVAAADVQHVWKDDTERERFMHTEKGLRQIETEELRRMEASNKLEATLMKFENLSRAPEVENAAQLAQVTQRISDWYYENNSKDVKAEEYEAKEDELVKEAEQLCHAYFERERKVKEEMEKDLERRAKENEGKEREDHDNRKLPNSQRLEKANRNKVEGNDMFSAGNWVKAAERYQQALGHLEKMFDESPSEAKEKIQLKISLNLNLAMVYFKHDEPEAMNKVVQRCDMALSYDENNSKALYRRGLAEIKRKNYEEALKDLQRCAKSQQDHDGAVDSATTKAIQKAKELLNREQEQRKRMYARMF